MLSLYEQLTGYMPPLPEGITRSHTPMKDYIRTVIDAEPAEVLPPIEEEYVGPMRVCSRCEASKPDIHKFYRPKKTQCRECENKIAKRNKKGKRRKGDASMYVIKRAETLNALTKRMTIQEVTDVINFGKLPSETVTTDAIRERLRLMEEEGLISCAAVLRGNRYVKSFARIK